MEIFEKHIEEVSNNFNKTLTRFNTLKKTIEQNKGLSQGAIGKLMGISASYVSYTIRRFNKCENEIKMTKGIDYFYKYNSIDEAEYIKVLKRMISDTKTNATLPIIENSELMNIYNITYSLAATYRKYMLDKLSELEYYLLLPDKEKEKLSNISFDRISGINN